MIQAQFVVRENPRIYALIERNPAILGGPPFGFPPVPPVPPM
jgi:hypothetical protein